MAYKSLKTYRKEIKVSLNDSFLKSTLDSFTSSYPQSRKKAFEGKDFYSLVSEIAEIKQESIDNYQNLYNEFKKNAEAAGAVVHLASDAEAANNIIAEIARKGNVSSVIKSKSMTSEEIHLNHHLESKGFEIVETDLGEWIIQLRNEGPSHMVMPAIHLSRGQVSKLFSEVTGKHQSDNIDKLVKVARNELREAFLSADMGISGANFAIAESGTIGLVTNEGNARLVTTLPGIHVALIGLEKLISNVDEALKIIDILPKNATGQNITSYISWITGATECTTTTSGKKELHIVFLDNNRSQLAKDPEFKEVLNCIRCGACANVCPVYGTVGGHKMGYTYIGPVGLVLTYFYHGIENARHLANNCINCQACKKICASGINLPHLINEVQIKIQKEDRTELTAKLAGKFIKNRKLFHAFLKSAKYTQKPFIGNSQFIRHLPQVLFLKDYNFISLPAIAPKSLRDLWPGFYKKIDKPKLKVAVFSGCLNEFVYPEQIESAVRLFQNNGIQVEFPKGQNCCGLPLMMLGNKKDAKALLKQNIKAINYAEYDFIITLCASCASFLKESYPKLIENKEKNIRDEQKQFSSKIINYSAFISNFIDPEKITSGLTSGKVAYHSPCHLTKGPDMGNHPGNLLDASGMDYLKLNNEEVCCGFGGTYSVKFPEISAQLLNKKICTTDDSGADYLVTDCPGCVMQLRGGAHKLNSKLKVMHMAELFESKKTDT